MDCWSSLLSSSHFGLNTTVLIVEHCIFKCHTISNLNPRAAHGILLVWNDVASLKLDADPDRWKECLEQATADDWPLYKLQVSSDNPSRAHKRWLEHISNKTPLPLSASREFLVGKQFLEGRRSPIGRGCKRFVALDVETQEFVDLKDFWHFEDPDQLPEFSIYAKVIEADVPNIPIFLCGGHISGIGQATIAHEFDQRLPKYRHGRFVVCEVTRPLETYANTHELTTVFQDALTGMPYYLYVAINPNTYVAHFT